MMHSYSGFMRTLQKSLFLFHSIYFIVSLSEESLRTRNIIYNLLVKKRLFEPMTILEAYHKELMYFMEYYV